MRKLKLMLVAVLLLCAACGVSQVGAEVKLVRLCGREIIRAMVYTCGGSRWRRLLTPSTDVFSAGDQSSSEGSDVSTRDLNHAVTNLCCQVGCQKSDLSLLC